MPLLAAMPEPEDARSVLAAFLDRLVDGVLAAEGTDILLTVRASSADVHTGC